MVLSHLVVAATATQSVALGNILFVSISFLILLALLKKFAWGPVSNMLEERAKKIAHDIDVAEQSKLEAQKLTDSSQKELNDARLEAQQIVNQAKETADNQAHAIIEQGKNDIKRMKAEADRDLRLERERMLQESKKEVADLSIQIAAKILKREISTDTHQSLIEDSIKQLGVDDNE